jgi:hypothetical protein
MVLNKEKALPRIRTVRGFLFPSLPNASICRAVNKKPQRFQRQGFFVADKRFEISNLLKDITELIKLSDTLMITSEMAE